MSNYAETKKELDRIRNEYGCIGEVLFRTALQLVVSVGFCTVLDDAWYQCEVDDVNAKHDYADEERKNLFVSRDFELAILECAREIAKVNSYDLLVYIQKEVWLNNDGGIDYKRAIELLKKCMADIEDTRWCNNKDTYEAFDYIGFTDNEIEVLGFGYVCDYEEEE